ncbi:MAG TPA: hypothetical protein VNF68_12555 [Candidatus Baltobacteraceae bacterium]|nr:hypothetical protein [Candidatus Baltobacteraceae bacterium]
MTVKDTRLVDSYGQLIGRDVRVARNPASAEPGLLLTNCIERAFANYRSYYAMHENHNDALQCVASGSAAEATLKSEWAKWSTLGPDDTFLPSRAEQSVVVTSVLDHGKYSQNEEDYAVQFKVTVHGDQDTGDTEQLWIGDFVIASNGTATDISPWGLYITRISVSKVKV